MSDRRHRPINAVSVLIAVGMWVLVVLNAIGAIPWWVFWTAFALYCVRLFWLYGPRPAAWRVTDERRPSWAKQDDNN